MPCKKRNKRLEKWGNVCRKWCSTTKLILPSSYEKLIFAKYSGINKGGYLELETKALLRGPTTGLTPNTVWRSSGVVPCSGWLWSQACIQSWLRDFLGFWALINARCDDHIGQVLLLRGTAMILPSPGESKLRYAAALFSPCPGPGCSSLVCDLEPGPTNLKWDSFPFG